MLKKLIVIVAILICFSGCSDPMQCSCEGKIQNIDNIPVESGLRGTIWKLGYDVYEFSADGRSFTTGGTGFHYIFKIINCERKPEHDILFGTCWKVDSLRYNLGSSSLVGDSITTFFLVKDNQMKVNDPWSEFFFTKQE